MPDYPPSRVRVVSHEAVSETEVRITMEMIVDVHRLSELGQEFLTQAITQIGAKKAKPADPA
ncbi:MAG TPA: hypothetical protein VGG48_12115 [Rhizomicrobium sp.]|jgi:hypothetical protein